MSRLIVKNLHGNVTEEKLREKFSEKGVVTDVQLKFTKDGAFRHFGFVGYQTKEEAEEAIKYFDKSYFNSLKIAVELCSHLGDENKPKAWSKYAPDSSAYKKLHPVEKKLISKSNEQNQDVDPITRRLNEKLEKFKNDPEFLEFLELHKKDRKIWGNDNIISFLTAKNESKNDRKDGQGKNEENSDEKYEIHEKKIANDETIPDTEYLKLVTGQKTKIDVEKKTDTNNYHTLVMRGLPYKLKKRAIKEFFRPLKVDSIRIPVKIKGVVYVGFKNETTMKKALLRNKSFIEGKQIFILPVKNEPKNHKLQTDVNENKKWKEQENALKMEEDVAESGRIFIRNLPYTINEDELQLLFGKYGPLSEIIVPIDKITRKIKGYGIVTFVIPEHAIKAFNELDGTIFHGRMLHLLPGKTKESEEIDIKEGSSFKTKKVQKLKAEAGSSYNWNTLFLGHNAVANVMATNYAVSKEEILAGSNAAVRLALGETQLVNETKEFLEESGVKLDAFNKATNHRSKTVILVKNLPANTTVNEIREVFAKHGVLGRTLLPPNGITAIVEFVEPAEARTAFRRLAYSKFKNLPLFLEWAPDDMFLHSSTENALIKTDETDNVATSSASQLHGNLNNEDDEDNEEEPEDDTTLFIKNLNFETTEDNIKAHFKNCGKISNVTIARKKDPKKPGGFLSMGYGFIQFYKKESLNVSLKNLQQSVLDGHCIELKRSNRTLKADLHLARKDNNVEKQTGSKILVRNIPFQAKQSELHELFKTFGDIKALRLPRKMVGTGPHRGFAFVEYHSKHDAKKAMQSLCQSTHLYGRRLVLEWAQSSDEDIEQIRKRTAEHFLSEKEIKSKKSAADIDVEESDDE